jgi:hypothetical protein
MHMDKFINLTPQQLRRAADVKERIDVLEKELSQLLGAPTSAPAPAAAAAAPKRKKISAAGIARIRAAQKARWAAVKKGKAPGKPAPQRRRKLSAAGRARLVALARARWAKVKAAGKTSL